MDMVNEALHTLGTWLEALIGLFLGIFAVIENFCQSVLNQAGVPENLQKIVLLLVAVVFIVVILRLFGGLIRWLIVLFLILLALHILLPTVGR
jgi:hypothetical protein